MFVPTLAEAKTYAQHCFRSLAAADSVVRFRLCERVERLVLAAAEGEEVDILRASAYLQEVGVIHSSREKSIYSLQMCERHFEAASGEDLHPLLVDCIRNHVRERVAASPEAKLMQICHKYAVTHFLDYMLLKTRISESAFEKLQLQRIEAYSAYLAEHPRGRQIGEILHEQFYGSRE